MGQELSYSSGTRLDKRDLSQLLNLITGTLLELYWPMILPHMRKEPNLLYIVLSQSVLYQMSFYRSFERIPTWMAEAKAHIGKTITLPSDFM